MSTIAPADFTYLKDLVQREAAIVLEAGKEYLATSRLEPVARTEGLDGIAGLVRALRTDSTGKLRNKVIDAMTTNETLWFRDSHPFETLRQELLPGLMEAKKVTRTLDIWCGASSTGQEPYSIAMMLKDVPQLDSWRIRMVATDISLTALDRARAGKYSQMEIGRGLPAKYLVRYFQRVGPDYQISNELKSMVDYRQLNLAATWPPIGEFDLIFIRNVLIYFKQDVKTQIINKAERLLRPHGYMFLGSTESLLSTPNNLERRQLGKTTCYTPKKG